MEASIRVTLPDGSEREYPKRTTVLEVAASIGPRLARDTVAGRVNGQLVDLRTPLDEDAELRIVTVKDADGAEVIRHSAEHVLADAVKRLWPGTPIDAGRQDHAEKYQYDFRFPRPFTPEDFPRIEEEMRRIIAEDIVFERIETDRERARALMQERGEDLKLLRLADIPEGETISLYRSGDFLDLCRGPHVQRTSQIGAVRLLESSGAYFKGDERNEMLQRLYGTAFASQQELDAYFARLEEMRRRDHRRLGRELDLFSFHAEAPASPFFHPRGAIVYNALIDLMREKYRHYGYEEVITPQIFGADLWQRSGHWDNYRDDMFFADGFELAGERTNSVKPMNCPSHCLIYATGAHSYRDLPRRDRRLRSAAPLRALGRGHRPDPGPQLLPGRRAHLLHAGADRAGDHVAVRLHLRGLRPVRLRRRGGQAGDPAGEVDRRPRDLGARRARCWRPASTPGARWTTR